jgi:hypothetical protein
MLGGLKMDEMTRRKVRIFHLKNALKATDYKAIKYAEGELTEEEYRPIREQRRAWRAEINMLETEIELLGGSV